MSSSVLAEMANRLSKNGVQIVYAKDNSGGGSTPGASSSGNNSSAGTPDPDDREPFKRPSESLKKGDKVDLAKFSDRTKLNGETVFRDPKSGYQIVKERSGNPHGGSAWKLLDKFGDELEH